MRSRWTRFATLAVVLTLGAIALAIASAGRAGSGPQEFDFFAQPTILSQGSNGVAWGRFKPSGGSATKLVLSVTIPAGFEFVQANSSPGCVPAAIVRTFDCPVGTVNPGQTVKRYVGFRAPTTLAPGTYSGFLGTARFDNGTLGAGGGGADTLTSGPVSITVVTGPDGDRDGGCSNILPRTDNVPLSKSNLVSTEIRSGTPLASLGLTCTWAFVGETSSPSGNSLSPISFFGFPQTQPGAPVEQVVTVYNSPVSFKDLKVFFDSDFSGPGDEFRGDELTRGGCTGPNNTLGATQAACLKSLVQQGPGAQAIILAKGTGADPGSGLG
jgi:hypothetical protein